jgi:hypothetical protein
MAHTRAGDAQAIAPCQARARHPDTPLTLVERTNTSTCRSSPTDVGKGHFPVLTHADWEWFELLETVEDRS